MTIGDVEITLNMVAVVVGVIGILIEVAMLAGPVFGNPERRRKQ